MLLVFGKRAGPHSMQQFNRLSRPARRPRVAQSDQAMCMLLGCGSSLKAAKVLPLQLVIHIDL
jgi:hypothetical protein